MNSVFIMLSWKGVAFLPPEIVFLIFLTSLKIIVAYNPLTLPLGK